MRAAPGPGEVALCSELRFFRLVLLATVALAVAPAEAQQLPALLEVPPAIAAAQPSVATRREALQRERGNLHGRVMSLNVECSAVNEGDTTKVASCTRRRQEVKAALDRHIRNSDAFNRMVDKVISAPPSLTQSRDTKEEQSIKLMNALVKRLPSWSAIEQDRVRKALNELVDRDPWNATEEVVRRIWVDVESRDQNGEIARKASEGDGPPGLPGAGTQKSFQDCAIFALANATGLPYGFVAARAAHLIEQAEWRDAAERANPQRTIERRGLNGGEVILLAEAFGQAEVVKSSDFAKTLKEGRRVLVNVVPEDGRILSGHGHEVVLTKAFQHNGETWFEMMDSNQGSQRRLYLSSMELNTIRQENGVAYRAEPGKTPKLLR